MNCWLQAAVELPGSSTFIFNAWLFPANRLPASLAIKNWMHFILYAAALNQNDDRLVEAVSIIRKFTASGWRGSQMIWHSSGPLPWKPQSPPQSVGHRWAAPFLWLSPRCRPRSAPAQGAHGYQGTADGMRSTRAEQQQGTRCCCSPGTASHCKQGIARHHQHLGTGLCRLQFPVSHWPLPPLGSQKLRGDPWCGGGPSGASAALGTSRTVWASAATVSSCYVIPQGQ